MTTAQVPVDTAWMDDFASLLERPGPDWERRVATVRRELDDDFAAAGPAAFDRFAAGMTAMGGIEREELHTATFELGPACIPYVGHHLFGEETARRGAFMGSLNARYAQAGFRASRELPDHLAVLLRFAGERAEAGEVDELVEFVLLGSLAAMKRALPATNPYHHLIAALDATLRTRHPGAAMRHQPSVPAAASSCLASIVGCGCPSEPASPPAVPPFAAGSPGGVIHD